ncbi:MAG: FABP family protein [Sphingomicrobium sp.]
MSGALQAGRSSSFPDDIFTEPANVDPDTLANLGPLRRLAGEWASPTGVDLNPKADGPERRDYIEHILMEPIDPQANGPQLFYGLRYHVHINTPEEDIAFHDQVGHWLWEPATGLVIQTLSIPRGQVAIAAGHAKAGDDKLILTAGRGSTEYGICSTAFLEYAFRTDHYRIEVDFHSDGSWSYVQETTLIVRGRAEPFIHRDQNRLLKIKEPKPNPWMQIIAARKRASASPAHLSGPGAAVAE